MSGKQTVFKTMNKGSWRMLQDCKIHATVHILNKAKNHKTKDDSQMGICEGQLNLAGTRTQGQKKAQRCLIFFVACICQIQLILECFPAFWCAIFQRERERDSFPSQKARTWLYHPHFLLTCSVRGTSCLSGYPWGCYCSTLSLAQTSLVMARCDLNWEFQNVWWKLTLLTSKFPC